MKLSVRGKTVNELKLPKSLTGETIFVDVLARMRGHTITN